MKRRSFLKALGITALGVTGAAAGAFAAIQYRENENQRDIGERRDPNAARKRRDALAQFAGGEEKYKIVGVDHGVSETDALLLLATPEVIKTVKEKCGGKVFFETPAFLSDLYKNASELSSDEFVLVYRSIYSTTASDDLLKAEHFAILAMRDEGVELVPYDRRFDNNPDKRSQILGARSVYLNQLKGAISQKLGIWGLFKLHARDILFGSAKATPENDKEIFNVQQELKAELNPAKTKMDSLDNYLLSQDAANLDYIDSQMKPGETALIFAGRSHVLVPNTLCDKAKDRGATRSMVYIDDDRAGNPVSSFLASIDQKGEKRPDCILSYATGQLVPVPKEGPVRSNLTVQVKGIEKVL